MTSVTCRPEFMKLSFSGCGFLCVYHAGVASAVQVYSPQILQNKVLGASAGSIIACAIATEVCMSKCADILLKIVTEARSRSGGPLHRDFALLKLLRRELADVLPPDSFETCTGRLVVSLTRWSDSANVLVEDFNSNEELLDAIMCSCFIPYYCGNTPPTFRGVQYVDGGISDNQPILDANTITVSPFAGKSDICPPDWDNRSPLNVDFNGTSFRCTIKNFMRLKDIIWPRSNKEMLEVCHQGFADALRFMRTVGIVPCVPCLKRQAGIKSDRKSPTEKPRLPEDGVTKKEFKGNLKIRKKCDENISNEGNTDSSECKTCGKSDLSCEDADIKPLFPKILSRAFEKVYVVEMSLFSFFSSFRLFRYIANSFGISRFFVDLAISLLKKMISYLDFASWPAWAMLKIKKFAIFFLMELEKLQSHFSGFSFFFPVTGNKQPAEILEDQSQKEMRLMRCKEEKMRIRKKFGRVETGETGKTDEESVVKTVKTEDKSVIETIKTSDTDEVESIKIVNTVSTLIDHYFLTKKLNNDMTIVVRSKPGWALKVGRKCKKSVKAIEVKVNENDHSALLEIECSADIEQSENSGELDKKSPSTIHRVDKTQTEATETQAEDNTMRYSKSKRLRRRKKILPVKWEKISDSNGGKLNILEDCCCFPTSNRVLMVRRQIAERKRVATRNDGFSVVGDIPEVYY